MFSADPAADLLPGLAGVAGVPEGFDGRLSLGSVELLGFEETVAVLDRLGVLVCWAQAQQARAAARLEELFARDIARAAGREDPGLALSLAAAEAGAVLNLPHMSAMRLISESSRLSREHPQTLARLEEGRIGYQHARIILDETQHVPQVADPDRDPVAGTEGDSGAHLEGSGNEDQPSLLEMMGSDPLGASDIKDAAGVGPVSMRQRFEADLLGSAEGRTAAGFGKKARRLRESRFPETIPVRHRDALERRRVCFEALPDGMSCLTAFLAAEQGQAIHSALSGAARAGKTVGDPRTMDQLRADILAAVLLDGDQQLPVTEPAGGGTAGPTPSVAGPTRPAGPTPPVPDSAGFGNAPITHPAPVTHPVLAPTPDIHPAAAPVTHPTLTPFPYTHPAPAPFPVRGQGPRRAERERSRNRSRIKTEVMVLINADTLAGLDDAPVELNGYGPISAEAGRRLILEALSWTPLLQDPASGEILKVGRRRRIPAGLKRWLQARDGTCRFPGCAVSVTRSEIDHTTPWARGGPTEHSNLEHLCPKHHRFKTLGHWKARQPEPGTIEWASPSGRTYSTQPALDHSGQPAPGPEPSTQGPGCSDPWTSPGDGPAGSGKVDDPAPF